MGYKFSDTVFIGTIFAATAQKIEQQQQKQQKVSSVQSPDGVFTINASAVLMFRSFSSNIQFNLL